MVYVPEKMQAAVRLLAARRGCRISDVYVEATAQYLATLGAPTQQAPSSGEDPTEPTAMAALAIAVERQGELVEELLDKVSSIAVVDPEKVGLPPMLVDTAAWAVATAMRLLLNAGEAGALKDEITELGKFNRMRLGLEHALYALKGVGLARSMGRRWHACWPPVQGTREPFIRGEHARFSHEG